MTQLTLVYSIKHEYQYSYVNNIKKHKHRFKTVYNVRVEKTKQDDSTINLKHEDCWIDHPALQRGREPVILVDLWTQNEG